MISFDQYNKAIMGKTPPPVSHDSRHWLSIYYLNIHFHFVILGFIEISIIECGTWTHYVVILFRICLLGYIKFKSAGL